nr:MAG TPA: hypothetical protein [Caudoviricetes sp.]
MERLHTVKCSNGYDYEMPIYDWENSVKEPVLSELLKDNPTHCWRLRDDYYAFNYIRSPYDGDEYIVNSITKKIEWTLPSMFCVLVGEEGTPITPDELRKALL